MSVGQIDPGQAVYAQDEVSRRILPGFGPLRDQATSRLGQGVVTSLGIVLMCHRMDGRSLLFGT
jgi:hypothetical protein